MVWELILRGRRSFEVWRTSVRTFVLTPLKDRKIGLEPRAPSRADPWTCSRGVRERFCSDLVVQSSKEVHLKQKNPLNHFPRSI